MSGPCAQLLAVLYTCEGMAGSWQVWARCSTSHCRPNTVQIQLWICWLSDDVAVFASHLHAVPCPGPHQMSCSCGHTAEPSSPMWSGFRSWMRGSSAGTMPASARALQPEEDDDKALTRPSSASTNCVLKLASTCRLSIPVKLLPKASQQHASQDPKPGHKHCTLVQTRDG